jgi:hypothetical protein
VDLELDDADIPLDFDEDDWDDSDIDDDDDWSDDDWNSDFADPFFDVDF